ncbi:MAG TPA: LysM domain-containing protein, partial [Burkholderiaceae bacterium]|nr:LysM domain-containing protein [Burkholderiaceae bacterium]
MAPGSYTVSDGDTLQSIAKAIYGDAAQWYRIAEANGLNLDTPLTAGQALVLPSVVGSANNAGTVNPYDPLSRIGDTNPTMPAPPPASDGGCGVLGQILIIVVAVVVTVYTAGALTAAAGQSLWAAGTAALGGAGGAAGMAAAAVGGAVGSIASQGVAIAAGMQDHFSWKQVALGAIGSGVTAGLGQAGVFNNLAEYGKYTATAARAAASSALTQGLAVATNLQEHFNWRAVATSAMAAPLAQYLGGKAGEFVNDMVGGSAGKFAGEFAQRMTAGVVSQRIRMAVYNQGKLDYASIAADAFGNVIGEGIVSAASQPTHAEQMSSQIQGQAVSNGFAAASLKMLAESDGLTADQLRSVLAKGLGNDRAAIMVAFAETHGEEGLRQLAEQQSQNWLKQSEVGFTLAGAVMHAGGLDP